MLLEFQLENFRSYHARKKFSLAASRQEELPENLMAPPGLELQVLRSAVLYGANASGKSNLFKAAWFLGDLMRRGSDAFGRPGDDPARAFALEPQAAKKPTSFEINFFVRDDKHPDGVRYEYGIGVYQRRIESEWLNAYPVGGRLQRWFVREPSDGSVADITFSTTLRGEHKRLRQVTPPGAPYLWVAEKFGHEQLSVPARWLQTNCDDPSQDRRFNEPRGTTARLCHDDAEFRAWLSRFLRCADLGIVGVQAARSARYSEEFLARVAPNLRTALSQSFKYDITFEHAATGQPVPLRMDDESSGTERLFDLLGPLWLALHRGGVVFIDEMSASMHPLLTQKLIETFHDPEVNRLGAQLILTTHDVSLLRGDLFRRDQVWFAEKNEKGETDLYSLLDYKPRGDVSVAKNYLAGRYGAIPFVGTFDFGTNDEPQEASQQARKRNPKRQGQADAGTDPAGAEPG